MKRVLIGFFLVGLAAGCGSDDDCNDCGGFKPPPGPPERTSPQNGVEYYRLAWESRDSTRIDSVLTGDYQGTSTDIGSTTQTLSFVKADEIRALHAMKNDANLTSVHVDFGPVNSWIRASYASDPPDWAVVVVPNPAILLQYANGSDLAVSSANDQVEFRLKPTAAGPDTTWQIIRWKEVHHSP